MNNFNKYFTLPLLLACIAYFTYTIWFVFRNPKPIVYTMAFSSESFSTNYMSQHILAQASRGHMDKLPPNARDILVCCDMHRDPAFWVAFTLPPREIAEFIEKTLHIQDETAFNSGISSICDRINDGPQSRGRGPLGNGQWNIRDTKNGKHFDKDMWYLGIDTDLNRIFMCYWTK